MSLIYFLRIFNDKKYITNVLNKGKRSQTRVIKFTKTQLVSKLFLRSTVFRTVRMYNYIFGSVFISEYIFTKRSSSLKRLSKGCNQYCRSLNKYFLHLSVIFVFILLYLIRGLNRRTSVFAVLYFLLFLNKTTTKRKHFIANKLIKNSSVFLPNSFRKSLNHQN